MTGKHLGTPIRGHISYGRGDPIRVENSDRCYHSGRPRAELAVLTQIAMLSHMTAHEVIDQIKSLPLDERAKVLNFVHELEAKEPKLKYADTSAFVEAAKWTFGEHAELMRKLSQ
jgi:hypothetical protein